MSDPKMTKTAYETRFSEESGLSKEKMRRAGIEAVPCVCGYDFCEGWMITFPIEEASHV